MHFSKTRKPTILVTLLVIFVTGFTSYSLIEHLDQQRKQQRILQLSEQTRAYANAIEQELSKTASAAYAAAAWVKLQQGDISNFEQYAEEIFPFYPHLTAISVAPAGIVSAVYPNAGNQNLLGHNIFDDPIQNLAATEIVKSRKLHITGPYQLVQGGKGVVARLPIYLNDDVDAPFWGFINVTFHLQNLASLLRLQQLSQYGAHYVLLKKATLQTKEQLILSSEPFEQSSFISASMSKQALKSTLLPENANWQLYLYPRTNSFNLIFARQAALAFLFTLLISLVCFLLLQTLLRTKQLNQIVKEKTQDLVTQLARHRSFVIASNTASWEYNLTTKQLHCSPEYFAMLGHLSSSQTMVSGDLETLWYSLIHPADLKNASAIFSNYLAQDSHTLYENQFRMRHQSGDWVWVLSRGRSITSAAGNKLMVGTHIDITERKESELKLQLLARLFEQSSEGLLITDENQNIVQVNQAFTKISGYQAAEVIGKNPKLLSSGKHDSNFYLAMWQAINTNGSWKGEIWNKRKNGHIYPEWLSISKIAAPVTGETYYIALFSDITQYKEDEAQIRFLAEFDSLTALPNRLLLVDRTDKAIAHCKNINHSLAMLVINIDRFKQINDSLGHQAGDALLIILAKRLQALCKEQDTLSRLSSDEFVLLRPGCDAMAAAALAEQILPEILKPCLISGQELTVSASIGIALYDVDGENFHDLYKHADIAMYQAKEQGRNTYCFFTTQMQKYHARHLLLENALRKAVERDELYLVYQPQYSLKKQKLLGFEVLLRWTHSELGVISPAEFIPLAERSGTIIPIGEWVLTQAIAQISKWQTLGFNQLSVAINLSPLQFRQPNLISVLEQLLTTYHVTADKVELEITESAMMEEPAEAAYQIKQFSQRGFHIAIDDFGTGYSSLSYLKRFSLNKLKIDQSFISDLLKDADDKAIVIAIINMAKSLGLSTIAEGVETAKQLAFLQELGCDDIQGYYYSKPLSVSDATAFIQAEKIL